MKILLYCLGLGGLKIYSQIVKKNPPADQGEVNAIEDLDAYFIPSVCVAVNRYKFYRRKQNKTETIEDYGPYYELGGLHPLGPRSRPQAQRMQTAANYTIARL